MCGPTGSTTEKSRSPSVALPLLCRATFFNTLLGVTFPLALCIRSSYARYVQAFCRYVCVPVLLYCHFVLLPQLQHSEHGLAVWQGLFGYWIAIPMAVFGLALLRGCREAWPYGVYLMAALGAWNFFHVVMPAIQPTLVGSVVIQILLFFFQGCPCLAWLWCLHHVVKVQDTIKHRPALLESSIKQKSDEDRALIIGNAPTVMSGRPLGSLIDGFDQIVRFNQYTVHKPEYTGSKVTHHFANGRNIPPPEVQAVMPLFNASLTHAAYLFFPALEHTTTTVEIVLREENQAWFVNEEQLLQLCKKMRLPFYQVPSSGMVAIDCFTDCVGAEYVGKTYLHGFSFFEGKKLHYFDEPVLQLVTSWLERYITHNAPREKAWVKGLVAEGKVRMLMDSVKEVPVVDEPSKGKMAESPKGEFRIWRLLEDALPSQFSM